MLSASRRRASMFSCISKLLVLPLLVFFFQVGDQPNMPRAWGSHPYQAIKHVSPPLPFFLSFFYLSSLILSRLLVVEHFAAVASSLTSVSGAARFISFYQKLRRDAVEQLPVWSLQLLKFLFAGGPEEAPSHLSSPSPPSSWCGIPLGLQPRGLVVALSKV